MELPTKTGVHPNNRSGSSGGRRSVIASTRIVDNNKSGCGNIINSDAFGFALRISLVLTASSLFVLCHPRDPYPQGSWVYITCVVVSWFPSSMDVASVLKKTLQRIAGTVVGAVLALAVGFATSGSLANASHRAILLGFSVAAVSFCVTFAVVRHPGVFGGFSYASVLVLMTFGIAVFPFSNDSDADAWKGGVLRVLNIVVGCILSAVGAVVVFPKPTYKAIQQSLAEQVSLAGQSSREVLQSAVQVFSNRRRPIPLRDKVSAEHEDSVYKLSKRAMGEFYEAKALYPLLPYDPFYLSISKNSMERSLFESETLLSMNRAFRIHATVLLINAIIHNDKGHNFSSDQLALFERASNLIPTMLEGTLSAAATTNTNAANDSPGRSTGTPTSPLMSSDACALELCIIMGQIRRHALKAADDLARSSHQGDGEDKRAASWNAKGYLAELGGASLCTHSATIFFLELVENLILRLLRLHMTMSGTSRVGDNSSGAIVIDEEDGGE